MFPKSFMIRGPGRNIVIERMDTIKLPMPNESGKNFARKPNGRKEKSVR